MRRLAVVVLAAAAFASPATAARLTVTPKDSLIDEVVHVRATGLKANAVATLTATTVDANGKAWRSRAVFRADLHGIVDPSRARSTSGTYTGRDAMGLFWSMLPVSFHGIPTGVGMYAPAPKAAVRFTLSVRGLVAARADIIRRVDSPEVVIRETSLAVDGFVGLYCAAPSATTRPAIMLLGGSEGGLSRGPTCPLLASHGYPTLTVAYFGVTGLPPELANIPLEYFQHALQWLAGQPGVDPSKVIVFGASRGGEAALLLGSVFPQLLHGVIGYVPSAYVLNSAVRADEPAWTLGGIPIPYATFANPTNPAAVIQVEKINGPIFVVGAVLDGVWPSAHFVKLIADRLRAHGRSDFTALTYLSGHGVGLAVPYLRGATFVQDRYGTVIFGGSPAADAKARAASWPRLLAFLATF